jgi:hypothetical protein
VDAVGTRSTQAPTGPEQDEASDAPDVTDDEVRQFIAAGRNIPDDLRDRIGRALHDEPDGRVARLIEDSCRYARNWLNVDWKTLSAPDHDLGGE